MELDPQEMCQYTRQAMSWRGITMEEEPVMVRRKRLAPAIILLTWLAGAASAQGTAEPDPLFRGDTTLAVRIVSALDVLAEERPQEEYVPGTLSYIADDGTNVELDIGIRTRGNFRRREDICLFPPLRLNFKKKQVEGTLFDGQDKMKLVTHCNPSSRIYEQAVVTEYLAYRILNLLTDFSFRARLLKVEYAQSPEDEGFQTFAFLIEHGESLARRIGVPELKVEEIEFSSLEGKYQNLTSVYQYLLGNTDFSPIQVGRQDDCCHNYALFGTPGELPYFGIPYDFDMSGFVNTPHSNPNPKLRLESVRERLYRGRCSTNDFLPDSVSLFVEHRQEINDLVNSQEELSARAREDLIRFIDGFYRTVTREKRFNREIVRRCL
jgi:hypothetical protein